MRILVISDVHANYRGLKAVIDKFHNVDEIWCLGDTVEYGPLPLNVQSWFDNTANMSLEEIMKITLLISNQPKLGVGQGGSQTIRQKKL